MKLYDALLQSADRGLSLQNRNGSMPAGHNGPRHDNDTPVRNTAHWLILFLFAYNQSGEKRYKEAAVAASNFLHSSEARPAGCAFYCRKNPNKNGTNGLIGQAWAMEGLLETAQVLGDTESVSLAKEVFLLHPFDEHIGLWNSLTVDGKSLPVEYTLNQHIWFALMGNRLLQFYPQDQLIQNRVMRFFEVVHSYFETTSAGLILHAIPRQQLERSFRENAFETVKKIFRKKNDIETQSVGYHSFVLFGLSLNKRLCKIQPEKLLDSQQFKAAAKLGVTEGFLDKARENMYGYSYNPTGIELAHFYDVFEMFIGKKQPAQLVGEQFERHYDREEGLMNKNTDDPDTLSARIYEATRLPNYTVL